ncbi:hypothetical protein FHG87_011348 [Trinorchestia longiramus]|nr:hypothetical protein FHG87_011348 [Trinorchestia longiramus]
MGTLADNLKRGSISLGSGHTPTVEEDLSHTNEVEIRRRRRRRRRRLRNKIQKDNKNSDSRSNPEYEQNKYTDGLHYVIENKTSGIHDDNLLSTQKESKKREKRTGRSNSMKRKSVDTLQRDSTQQNPQGESPSRNVYSDNIDDLAHFSLASKGSLHEAVLTSLRYPYRKGSARVVLISACSLQDINTFSPELVEEFRRRDIAVFFISPRSIFASDSTHSPRFAIGVDRFWVYRLHGARMQLTDTWGILPPDSNVGRLAIYSGGGVFSSAAITRDDHSGDKRDKKQVRMLRLYKTVLAVSVVNRLHDMASLGN